jgi:NADPH-dependent curcumin reductase CurA
MSENKVSATSAVAMIPKSSRHITIASVPSGLPTLDNFAIRELPLEPLQPGQVGTLN